MKSIRLTTAATKLYRPRNALLMALLLSTSTIVLSQTSNANRREGGSEVGTEPEVSTAVYGDWAVLCRSAQIEGLPSRLCEITHMLKTTVQVAETGSTQTINVAQLAIGRVRKSDPFSITGVLPVDVIFPSKVSLVVEGDPLLGDLALNWIRCLPSGCFATLVLNDAQLKGLLQASGQARLQWLASSGATVQLPVSLRGMAQAFKQL